MKRNLMVFLRPSIVRDAAGLERISRGRYRSIQLLRGAAGEPARPLFEDAGATTCVPPPRSHWHLLARRAAIRLQPRC